jgi:hypothetical protein
VDRLVGGLEDGCDRVLCQPIDLQVGLDHTQLLGDGQIAPGMTETDW